MNALRRIDRILTGPRPHWVGDGFRVMGYFSQIPDAEKRLSPFLLLDYHEPYDYPATDNERRGVGPHPHRGFETVTLAFQGSVAHHDSTGRGGVIGPGDVQWMTAASGILHREYHEASWARAGGTMHMAQIWVNLPRAHKMDPPGYQAITADRMGIVELPHGRVRVIAGAYQGVRGPAKTFTPVTMLDAALDAGGRAEFSFPARENLAILVMQGEIAIQDETARVGDFVLFANEGERVTVEARSDARLLVLAGEPIEEPVVAYGPFVMNAEGEIRQAMLDFQSGKFGFLED
ncbi:MAG TPA: pirin family protein [Thermoanaerobaculia bacterium]|nr:pirin family protein [Thermoanaerobaculia bacterium]